jgi:hypothetical protein
MYIGYYVTNLGRSKKNNTHMNNTEMTQFMLEVAGSLSGIMCMNT